MHDANAIDVDELQEWLEALDDVLQHKDKQYAASLLEHLVSHYQVHADNKAFGMISPALNSVHKQDELPLPEGFQHGYRAHQIILWNAMVMVLRAGKHAPELGGHIATFASIATLYRIGFDYFFRQDQPGNLGDLVYFQGHASPGVYARSFLEGRLSEAQLDKFRQEAGAESGLSSYPHPHLMPKYWQFPTVSMGLGPLMAIYQARWQRYLHGRIQQDTSNRKIWAFCGDGEMDEPESRGCLQLAAREGLDNLIFVVNCNLQRLDGPVRGNGSIVAELESFFKGAGWHVLKVLNNSAWDEVFALDSQGKLAAALSACVDGQLQTLCAAGPETLLAYLAAGDPDLQQLVATIPKDVVARLAPGGHDASKVYNVYHRAMQLQAKPVVILAHTIKGYGLGDGIASANTTHQQKKISSAGLHAYAKLLQIPLDEQQIEQPAYYHPGVDDPAVLYIKQRREQLGGFMPKRDEVKAQQKVPALSVLADLLVASERQFSTTMAFVRVLSIWLRQQDFADRLVPIVPDESRTFGMEGLFRQIGIYTSQGQQYEPVDKKQIMYYKESEQGQLLQEGINEAGAMASWIAAATSYSNNQQAMLPMYIFYSMFGFQRVGDLLWAAGDMHARGFLFGATAGRTTLAGEGLQHNDGHSQMMAALIPNCISYDPCFAYELAVIIQHGARRMFDQAENVFYYITLMNENYKHPKMPDNAQEGIIKGMYVFKPFAKKSKGHIHLLGSGCILREVIKASKWLCAQEIDVQVWSVTSFTELARAALQEGSDSYVASAFADAVPVLAATDYVRSYPEQIRPYIQGSYQVLGTDGFGRSDTRQQLRSYFGVSAADIAKQALIMVKSSKVLSTVRYNKLVKSLATVDFNELEE